MSTSLDTRGRQAAERLTTLVEEAPLLLADPPTARTAPGRHPVWAAMAGVTAAIAILVGMWLLRPPIVADEETVSTTLPPTTVTTTAPTSAPPTSEPPPPSSTAPAPVAAPGTAVADTTPPPLEITHPEDGATFTEELLTFEGITEPGATVTAGPYRATVDADGAWAITLVLWEGENPVTFTATDAAGNHTEATLTVTYAPTTTTTAKPTTSTTEKSSEKTVAAFDANFTWGECDLDPPFDEYYGTGEPGTTVKVTSDYGSGSTEVGADGSWYVKVFFPDAPAHEPFPVKVKDSLGRYEVFEFTSTVEG